MKADHTLTAYRIGLAIAALVGAVTFSDDMSCVQPVSVIGGPQPNRWIYSCSPVGTTQRSALLAGQFGDSAKEGV